jgi:Trk K+ transport system NAD-binding subunit
VVPRGDTRLDAGDEVIALVTADSEDSVRQLLVGARA